MRSYPAPTYPRVSDGEERTQSETFDSRIEITPHHLSQLRSGRVVTQWLQWDSLLIVWLRAESQRLGGTPADNRPARCPRRARLRGVRTSRDAPPPRRGIPLSGVRF